MPSPVALVALGCGAALLLRRHKRRAPPVLAPMPVPIAVAPAPPGRLERIEELLKRYVTDDPTPGHFYQVQFGDTPEGVARAALGTLGTSTAAQRLEYVHCMSGGQHNLRNYGTPSTSRSYPPRLLLPGLGQGLRVAFSPRNDDALALMLSGIAAKKRVDPKTGAPISNASSYGLLWLPPVDPGAFLDLGDVTCSGISWDDGSSSLEPPPELLGLLQEAA